MKFSANLGFLWSDLLLPDAIRKAKDAGFDAVECHWPYEFPAKDIIQVLRETGLNMIGINTIRGKSGTTDFGLTALPDRKVEAHEAIDQAILYASQINARNVHVMAGNASGKEAHETFVSTLRYACANAGQHDIMILIEPINAFDAPDYFLTGTDQAMHIINEVNAKNLKLMFDCYHVQRMEGDVLAKLRRLMSHIGHIQFASVPDRGPPDHGELDHDTVFNLLKELRYDGPLGAEYKPDGDTDASLGWLRKIRVQRNA